MDGGQVGELLVKKILPCRQKRNLVTGDAMACGPLPGGLFLADFQGTFCMKIVMILVPDRQQWRALQGDFCTSA